MMLSGHRKFENDRTKWGNFIKTTWNMSTCNSWRLSNRYLGIQLSKFRLEIKILSFYILYNKCIQMHRNKVVTELFFVWFRKIQDIFSQFCFLIVQGRWLCKNIKPDNMITYLASYAQCATLVKLMALCMPANAGDTTNTRREQNNIAKLMLVYFEIIARFLILLSWMIKKITQS